jgi:hypothetical protein
MAFFRFIAIVLLVLAFLFLGGDVVSSLEKGDMVMRGLTEGLALFGADPTAWIERTFPSGVADIFKMVMSWPAWATLGVLGLVIGALSYGRPDGYRDPDEMSGFADGGNGD